MALNFLAQLLAVYESLYLDSNVKVIILFFKISECKKGFHLVPGDYPGWGQLGSYTNIEDTEKCGSLCQSTAGCLSYEFSTSERKCNLNSAIAPSQGIYKDYAFCVTGNFKIILAHGDLDNSLAICLT